MKTAHKGIKLIIKENAIGYGLYAEKHWYEGQEIEPCYYNARTKESLKIWVDEHPGYYLDE